MELDFPARPARPATASPELLRGLGRRPSEVLATDLLWLCVYETAEEVAALTPDHATLATTVRAG